MMRDTILKIINEIRQTKGLVVLESIKEEQTLRNDLELTSFDLAELTVKIEDEYDIDIFEDGLVNTVGEIFAKLEK
jgi:acyl carrier protein